MVLGDELRAAAGQYREEHKEDYMDLSAEEREVIRLVKKFDWWLRFNAEHGRCSVDGALAVDYDGRIKTVPENEIRLGAERPYGKNIENPTHLYPPDDKTKVNYDRLCEHLINKFRELGINCITRVGTKTIYVGRYNDVKREIPYIYVSLWW